MSDNKSIGFFDSGVGGLSVMREVVKLLPHENCIYLADNANCPYGEKSAEAVKELALKNTSWLLRYDCKAIVVACNTATAAAIETLRTEIPEIPFIGMEPAVKPAALASKTHIIGVLATTGTLHGNLFLRTSQRFAAQSRILVRGVRGWVESVERGEFQITPKTLRMVSDEITPLLKAGADSLVLGCTHFPFLRDVITEVAGPDIKLYDSGKAVARQLERTLATRGQLADSNAQPQRVFFHTGSAPVKNWLTQLAGMHTTLHGAPSV